jgi:nitrogen fixation protein FixH
MIRAMTRGPFTGRHISAIIVGFFAVVIAVNFVMAYYASATFGGVVVENSYVASQQFNQWLEEGRKQQALGWSATASRSGDDRIVVRIEGAPAQGLVLSAIARHPLGRAPDQALGFVRQADGSSLSNQPLPAGRWIVRFEARAGSSLWRSEQDLR